MSNKSAESRDNSPDGSPEKRASKKRKVLSCYACRNRKMKCDRVYPVCGRCQRTGRGDQCSYDPRLLDDLIMNGEGGHMDGGAASFVQHKNIVNGGSSTAPVLSDTLAWKVRVQERRIENMERKLERVSKANAGSLDAPPSHLDYFDAHTQETELKEEMMFRGRGFKTQFYGSTSPLSVVTQFSELQAFTREATILDSSMTRIRGDFKAFRSRRKVQKQEVERIVQGSDTKILQLLPEKSIVDAKVALYFKAFETTYRILHEPTFWNEYRTFWEQRQGGEVVGSFATILVLIVALTKCLAANDMNVFMGDSSADRETASDLIEACDAWLQRQSRKHLTLHFFQLHCLSLLARRVNCLKLKQDWVTSGDLIRIAMASGMHRNPSLMIGGRVSEFEKEMRRRLWVTIMELELQSSIDSGLQSSLCGLYVDTQPPANIPDDDILADLTQAPSSRPMEHFTSTSYLTVSLRSLPLRVHLMQLLNNPTTNLQYSDVLHYDAQLNASLSLLPAWNDPRAATASALLDFQIRQFLLMLHRPYALAAFKTPHFNFSFTACVDASNGLLTLYDDLRNKGILSLNHLRNDVLRIVVTLAPIVYYNSVFPSSNEPATPASNTCPVSVDPAGSARENPFAYPIPPNSSPKVAQLPHNNFLVTTLSTTAISLIERARALYEAKVMRLGTGYMEYWLISASIGILPSTSSLPITSIASLTSDNGDIKTRVWKAIDRMTALCFRVLAMQKDPGNSFASSMRTTLVGGAQSDMRTPISNVVVPTGNTPSGGGEGWEMPNLLGATGLVGDLKDGTGIGAQSAWNGLDAMQVDLAGWTFPDFWAFDMGGDF